jgi:RNA polymerase sigma factor (sigma-70 family)
MNELFESHKNIVYTVLSRHKIFSNHSMHEDCLQAGYLALVKAINTFDPKRAKLSTYAYWLIREAVQKELAKQPIIRIGTYETMLNNKDKILFLSLDYQYPMKKDDGTDHTTLQDVIPLKEEEEPYSQEKIEMLLSGLRMAKLTKIEKERLRLWMDGELDYHQHVTISWVMKKIKRHIKRKYKVKL